MWQLGPDLVQPVSEMLSKTYGISGERVSQQLADVAGKLVADYWDNNGEDIRAIVDGSLLMDYDEAGVEMQFKSAAAISVTYTLLERCGFEPAGWFDKDDFQAIHDFSTPDAVFALGAAVSDMSREVLRQIERTVKTTIRRRNAERSQYEYEQQERDLLDRRGLPAPEPDPEPAPEAAGQVRQAAPDVPDEPSPGAVQHDAPEREPVPAPDGSGADSREPDAADHGAASETDPGPGQSAEPTDVGAAHEQSESAGRGTGDDGADLQLSFLDANIPTEAQQIEEIDRAESKKMPSAFVLSQAEIENELRKHGSGFAGGKQRIMALYQTQPDRKLRAKALAKEYGIGGHSHDFLDGSRGFVNHDWKGLEFDHYPDYQKINLKWAQVEKYIALMIQSDRYLTDEEKEQCTTVQEENGYKVGDDVMVDLPTGTIEGTISLALNPMGSIQKLKPIIRSQAAYAPPEVVDGKPPIYPYTPIKSSFEDAGSVEEMMMYTELQSAVHAMIQRLEYSFTFNPTLLTIPKRKQQVAEILEEAEKYIWRIKEEMRCA